MITPFKRKIAICQPVILCEACGKEILNPAEGMLIFHGGADGSGLAKTYHKGGKCDPHTDDPWSELADALEEMSRGY